VPLTLKEVRARRGRLPMAECVRHGVELARALAALHGRGLLHRDIKPSNVILVNGLAKLADVGLVAAAQDARTFVGTEGFVPPEGPGTPSADVYALGKLLYELATGIDRADFPQMPADLGAPAERAAFFALNDILLRACDDSPARRYRDGAALLADLEALQAGRPRDPSSTRAMRRSLALAGVAAVVVAAMGWGIGRLDRPGAAPADAAGAAAIDTAHPEARRLITQAWKTIHSAPEPSRPEIDAANDLCRRATDIDPGNAEAWAVGAYVDSWYVAQNIDRSAARREAARVKAARAMKLAPNSFEARFAHAGTLARSEGYYAIHTGGVKAVAPIAAEAEPQLRALLKLRPDEPRVLYALGQLLYLAQRTDESAAVFDRMAKDPDWRATAYAAKGWTYAGVGRWDEAVAAAERSIAEKPFFGNVILRLNIAQNWTGDLDLALRTFDLLPREELREDIGMLAATMLHWWRREPDAMLRYLQAVPREWIQTNGFTGPKDYWVGLAHAMAGRPERARLAWRAGLRLVDQRLADEPNAGKLLFIKAQLHSLLGEREATRAVFDVAHNLFGGSGGLYRRLMLGEEDPDQAAFKGMTWARLKYWPELDPLRGDPRFAAELAAAAADPKRSPQAKAARTPFE
jgi:tetratricopeptide (TPR) repeat protein